MASGPPVIAFAEGGARDSIVPNKTGIFFTEQSEESLAQALEEFAKIKWNSSEIKKHAEKFSEERFAEELREFISSKLEK